MIRAFIGKFQHPASIVAPPEDLKDLEMLAFLPQFNYTR